MMATNFPTRAEGTSNATAGKDYLIYLNTGILLFSLLR